MKQSNIPNMSAQECMDELTFIEIKKLLQKARKAQQRADECCDAVFNAVEDMCIDLDIEFESDIYNYIHDDEVDLKDLMNEIRTKYCKDNQGTD